MEFYPQKTKPYSKIVLMSACHGCGAFLRWRISSTCEKKKKKSNVGLKSYVGLTISYVRVSKSYVGLSKSYVGLIISYVGLFFHTWH